MAWKTNSILLCGFLCVLFIRCGEQQLEQALTAGNITRAKAILAFSPPETIKTLLGIKLHPFTRHTMTDKLKLRRQLKEIKAQGIAYDHEEIDEGTSAIGAPIFNHEEIPVAGVVVAGPSQRISGAAGSEMVAELRHTAKKISAQLYYREAPEEFEVKKEKKVG